MPTRSSRPWGFSLPYKLYELFPPLWPQLAEMPLLAAVVGALFVGVGAGLSVRAGGASGGDDALAMCIAHVTGMGIQWAYLPPIWWCSACR